MNKAILDAFNETPYFTVQAIQQLAEPDALVPGSVQTALYRWMKNGTIIQLKKGMYMTRPYFESHRKDADFTAAVSGLILSQSYLSMDSVFRREKIARTPENVITCITSGNTRTIQNPIGIFQYRHVKPELFNHFALKPYQGLLAAVASLPKALFDYFYFTRFSTNTAGAVREAILGLSDVDLKAVPKTARKEFFNLVYADGGLKMNLAANALRSSVWRT